ncbi:MAG: SusC/RagA family TonB-linked outer membrane protein, partial [Gemmatimonadota bacterium]|nr:SusC/RagA family TonB-linked outer membrane protein [Gemmatimonadota bacterium]
LGSAGTIQGVRSGLAEWALQSYMGRLNYGFRDRYLLTLTGRLDGSSRLAPGNKYSFFPSAAVAWRMGDEPFVRDLGVFSDLKLRASYGVTGNTSIDPYQTQGALNRTTYSFGGAGAFGFRPGALSNRELEWEKTRSFDAGVDFGLFDNRVSGTLDFYVQNTYDLLLERQLPGSSGFGSILENVGQTRNTGLELGLSTVNLDGWRGLRWTTDVAWSSNRNEIVSLFGGKEDDVGNVWFIGKPIHSSDGGSPSKVWYDYQFGGIWQQHQAEEAAKYKQKPGQIRVIDQNNDGKIDGLDRVIVGTLYPKWTGSLANRFEWGSFDLSALATARWGYTINSSFHTTNNSLFGRYNNLRTNYWTPQNPSNTDPRPNADQEFPIYGGSRAYRDGSHVRIRNVTLGYTVPARLAGRVGGESLRIYASAQDPFVFTNYDGFDPESGTSAGSPSYRTLLIGASVGF